jgi:hypothetical protein
MSCSASPQDIFDKYNVDLGLENHDHAYKRSKLIKNRQIVDSGGTLYIGDGSMGVESRPAKSDRDYIQVTEEASCASAPLPNDVSTLVFVLR